jgi:Flp pilus assembly protein TadD
MLNPYETLEQAMAHHRSGDLQTAESLYRQILAAAPNFADAWNLLGVIAAERGDPRTGVESIQRAIQLAGPVPSYLYNLGLAYLNSGDWVQAERCYREVLRAEPNAAEVYCDLGMAVQKQGRVDEAVGCYRRSLAANPGYPVAHYNLALAMQELGRLDEAESCYQRAIQCQPDYAIARWNRSLLLLLRGDYQQGWAEYEWRWRVRRDAVRPFPQPLWDGRPLSGRTILLHAEQALGDTIQFARYAPMVKQQGGRVVLECAKSLVPLLSGCPGVDVAVGLGDPLPPFDVHTPLLTLPRLFRTTLANVPAEVPYLQAKPELIQAWRERLAKIPGFKIGIAWQGSPTYTADRQRSIPLAQFAPLAEIPGVRLISLQKCLGTEQLAEWREPLRIEDYTAELDEASGPFMDTAAIIRNLDLVIVSDSAVAHLAGALAARVWVPLPLMPDWRWLLDRDDSPWYPTMRLFRQRRAGNWDDVFAAIAEAVAQQCGQVRS